MIQRLKQITKFMAVCALLVLGSCEKDIYENQIEQNRVKTVNLNDLPMLQNAIASKRNSITLTGKSIVDYLNLIQPNGIKLAEVSDGKKFYTCALNIDEYQKLTNLLIEEKNGVYDYKLIEYTANDFDAWKAKVEQQRLFDIMPIVTIKDLEGRLFDFGFGPCVQVYGVCPSGLHLCNNSDVDPECNYLLNEWNFITVPVSCYGLPEGASPSQGNSTSSNGSSGSSSGGGGGGSGSGSNSGSSTNGSTNNNFNSQIITTPLVHGTLLEKKFLSFISQLNQQSQDFLNDDENSVIRSNVRAYLVQNNFSSESVSFMNWGINYLIANPTTTFEQFQNWFMTPREGKEDITSNNLSNLSLTFPTQNLPTFDDFILAFPSHFDTNFITAEQVYTSVGGAVLTKYNQGARNTCALRISKGLNYSGVTIPNIPGVTVKGADNKNYFLVAKNLLTWMKATFGTPTGSNHLSGSQGGAHGENFPNLLNGKEGIYIMIPTDPSSAGFDATGHADMFFSGDCDGGCYFNATGGVSEIFFWELP